MQKRILVFDDDCDLLEICQMILEQAGFTVSTSTNCTHLIDSIKAFNADLIIMDHRLPGTSGVEAIKTIKQTPSLKHIPIILYSGDNSLDELASEAGADYYLAKPFDIAELEKKVKIAIGEHL